MRMPCPTLHARLRKWFATITLVAVTSLVGCGNEFGATASGVVTLDGQPVTPGLVTFAPADPAALPAVSDLDADGGFELTTQKKPGLTPGTYRVSVQAFEPPDVPKGQRSFEPSKPLVPEKYLQTTTSGLEYTIESGSNTINVELVSD